MTAWAMAANPRSARRSFGAADGRPEHASVWRTGQHARDQLLDGGRVVLLNRRAPTRCNRLHDIATAGLPDDPRRAAVYGRGAMAGVLIDPSRETAPTTTVSSQPGGVAARIAEIIAGGMWSVPWSVGDVVVTGVS